MAGIGRERVQAHIKVGMTKTNVGKTPILSISPETCEASLSARRRGLHAAPEEVREPPEHAGGCRPAPRLRTIAHLSAGDGPEAWGWAAGAGVLWGLSYFFWRRLQATPASA